MVKRMFLIFAGLLIAVPLALAQVSTGTISGTVRDATGAVVPNASVTAKNVETGVVRSLSTDGQGRYQFPNLALGRYEIQVSQAGFQTAAHSGIDVSVGQEAVVNMALQLGQVAERVEVAGEAPLVEATNAAITGLVDNKTIRELPLNGRSFDQLVLLQVGTIYARRDESVTALGGGTRISISGTRPQQSSFLLDGTDINDARNTVPGGAAGLTLGVDTVREFRVLTNSYSAEYGRSSGGVVMAVTRSGTNALHGTVFEFLRNSVLDARNFFDIDTANPLVRSDPPPFKRNQFGFTLGGPIRKNRTFFFGSYEGLRERLGLTLTNTVPDALAHQGILPQGGRVGAPLVNVGIAPGVKPWLDLYPVPNGRNFGNGTGEFIHLSSRRIDEKYFMARIDHTVSTKHSVFGRYTIDDGNRSEPEGLPIERRLNTSRSHYLTVEADSVLSATSLNAFRFGLNRSVPRENLAYTGVPESLTFVPGVPFNLGGQINITPNLTDIGDFLTPKALAYSLFEWSDDVTRVQGRHTVKAGLLLKRVRDNEDSVNARAGRFQFRGGLLDFMEGRSSNFAFEFPGTTQYRGWRQIFVGLYGQDDIKLTSRLTLNLGVREEFMTSPTEVNGRCANVTDVMQQASKVGCPFFETFKNNWAPRVGLAWDTRGDSRLVLRGGFGLFYDQPFSTYWRAAGRFAPPFTIISSLTNPPFPNAISLIDLNNPPLTGADLRTQKYTGTTYVMQYNFNIQSEIRPGTDVTIGYMASQGRKLFRTGQMNIKVPVILPDGRQFFPANAPRRNPVWTNVRLQQTDANSNYNALVISVHQRFRAGLRLQGSYSFSKIMSDSDRVFGRDFSGGELNSLDPFNVRRDRALAGYNLQHNLVINYGYDLPFKAPGALGRIVNGWQISGITNVSSGAPFSATAQCCSDNGSTGVSVQDRPDLAPGRSSSPVLGGPDNYFDPAAFVLSPRGFYGTVGRNTIIGPGLVTFDASLVKNTAISEKLNLQFRAELFNLFNRSNFGTPAAEIFDARGNPEPTAGRITDTSTKSRQIQFALKLVF